MQPSDSFVPCKSAHAVQAIQRAGRRSLQVPGRLVKLTGQTGAVKNP